MDVALSHRLTLLARLQEERLRHEAAEAALQAEREQDAALVLQCAMRRKIVCAKMQVRAIVWRVVSHAPVPQAISKVADARAARVEEARRRLEQAKAASKINAAARGRMSRKRLAHRRVVREQSQQPVPLLVSANPRLMLSQELEEAAAARVAARLAEAEAAAAEERRQREQEAALNVAATRIQGMFRTNRAKRESAPIPCGPRFRRTH